MPTDRTTELYKVYGPTIYGRCVRLLGDDAAAKDAAQETFIRVHRHLTKAPDGREALAWIYRIATNICLNELRNRKLRPEPRDELPEVPFHAEPFADRDLVTRLLARIPEKVSHVAWLHHVDGMDQVEVARVLGISRRTVANRLAVFAESARKFVKRAAE